MPSNISLLGLYNFNHDLFEDMVLPDAVDRDDLIDNIVLECAELEVLYPDYDFLKQAIGAWSRSRILTWNRMALVLTENYDPFINIKRDEHRTITETRDLKNTGQQSNKVNAYNSGTGTESGSVNASGTDTGTVITDEVYHIEGDSAITDAQDVMMKEVRARELYDIYKYIIMDFKRRFCLLVY